VVGVRSQLSVIRCRLSANVLRVETRGESSDGRAAYVQSCQRGWAVAFAAGLKGFELAEGLDELAGPGSRPG